MTAFPIQSSPAPLPFVLRDGRPLWVGPVTPAARPVIERALARLTPETSRRRFFTVRYRLSDRELDDLTQLDGVQRYAVGATVVDPAGGVEGVGVARFVRVAETPTAAEVAVLVVDAFQGQGVGRMLLARLMEAGVARGIARFRGIVLPDNKPMLGLLRKHAPRLLISRGNGHLDVDVHLALPGGAAISQAASRAMPEDPSVPRRCHPGR